MKKFTKEQKENFQLYVITAMMFACFSLPFISFFQDRNGTYDRHLIKSKNVNQTVKQDSVTVYKYFDQKQRD